MLRVLLGLLDPIAGRIRRASGVRYGYVKQRESLNETYPFTVDEVVMMGRYGLLPGLARPGAEDHAAVEEALVRTGIADLQHRPLRELSGGQKQRALIARALAARPDVVVLDEPTNDMDIAGEQSVLDLIQQIHRRDGTAVIIVSHLLHTVLQIAQNVMFLKGKEYGVFSKAEFIGQNHLERFYGMPIEVLEHPGGRYSVVPNKQGSTTHESK
jgi:ABC-type Mn2+/Zn2+ transport system ATPase subunit